ncbi:MAG TPA: 4a-hydroxytetrahydrobiopterin dehydratase [Longimicrobiales bacterium]|nr:4a-hydroxytetrahydrobiopterin dehydratase [Longimicrobiales bacterium]
MSARDRLSDEEVAGRIHLLDGWTVRNGRLHRELQFESFADAFGFMTSVAIHAQEMNHHPDWSNSYNKVVIDLMSHDVDGLSERDFELAGIIERRAATAVRS